MNASLIFILTGTASAALAISFASLYFKAGFRKTILKPLAAYLAVNLLMAASGFLIGNHLTGASGHFSTKAGAALLLVIAAKIIFRAIRTKTIQRIFDIGKDATLLGLMFVLNIDILLIATALPMVSGITYGTGITLFAVAALCGLSAGVLAGKKAGFIFSNLLDLIAAIALLMIGIPLFF
jgi:putative Mn2+ efflux pump MntP